MTNPIQISDRQLYETYYFAELNVLATSIGIWRRRQGFDSPEVFADTVGLLAKIALMHSELGEASEAVRKGDADNFAEDTYENYTGDAMVVFRHDGELYEVNGSHCSCYGLERQWQPERVVVKELVNRPRYVGDWYTGHSKHNHAIRDVLRGLPEAQGL